MPRQAHINLEVMSRKPLGYYYQCWMFISALDINISVGCIAVHGKRKKMEVVSISKCGIDHNAYDTDLITFRQTVRKKLELYSCF